jgi:predicted permease
MASVRSLVLELRLASRGLWREPGLVLTVTSILGASIGACIIAFAVGNALFLRPLAVFEPERLVVLWEEDLERDRHLFEVSFKNFLEWKAASTSFENMAAMGFHDWGMVLLGEGGPERIPYRAVAASFFGTLGAEPLLGRTFVPGDDDPEAPRVVVLSHGLWQRRFGADAAIVGRTLTFETARAEEAFTVVGVMPAEFRFPAGSALWAPAGREMADIQRLQGISDEDMRWIGVFNVVARLKPRATREGADADMDAIIGALAASIDRRHGAVVTPFTEFLFGRTRVAVFALLAAVGLVVAIACANVSSLLTARALARQQSFAIRRALGASRVAIGRSLFAESLLLALGGATVGLSLAIAGLDPIAALAPPNVPALSNVPVDSVVLAFALLLAITTALVSSVLPFLALERFSRRPLRTGGRLVVPQTAFAVVVLVGTGLVGKSFFQLVHTELGFEPKGLLTFAVSPSPVRYTNDGERRLFYRDILDRLESLEGVDSAGAVLVRPYRLGAIGQDGFFLAEGQSEEEARQNPIVNWQVATPGYFRAMGTRLLIGRGFEATDDERTPPVTVVSESLARRMWPGQNPIGRRLRTHGLALESADEPWATVVGVVEDVRYRELDRTRPNLYLSHRQVVPAPGSLSYVVRTGADPMTLAGALARAVQSLDSNQPLDALASMEEVVEEAQAPWRFASVFLSSFAVLAIALAALGVLAVLSRSISERRRELGVRMAVGARAGQIQRLVIGRALRWTLLGIALGLALAWPTVGFLSSLLFEVRPTDPVVFSAIAVLVLTVSLLASWIPARRAAATDPVAVLRGD